MAAFRHCQQRRRGDERLRGLQLQPPQNRKLCHDWHRRPEGRHLPWRGQPDSEDRVSVLSEQIRVRGFQQAGYPGTSAYRPVHGGLRHDGLRQRLPGNRRQLCVHQRRLAERLYPPAASSGSGRKKIRRQSGGHYPESAAQRVCDGEEQMDGQRLRPVPGGAQCPGIHLLQPDSLRKDRNHLL